MMLATGSLGRVRAWSLATRMRVIPPCITRWSWTRKDGSISARLGWDQKKSLAAWSRSSARRILAHRTSLLEEFMFRKNSWEVRVIVSADRMWRFRGGPEEPDLTGRDDLTKEMQPAFK